jgi:hypothetical protein
LNPNKVFSTGTLIRARVRSMRRENTWSITAPERKIRLREYSAWQTA